MTKTSNEIRRDFLEFFHSKGHEIVPSSPLVPGNDASLLFTNAGMVQFKDVFLGAEKRSYTRAVSAQRCVRAGGKHNDLDQVGYTARHHTFFEMLGNFSFGDYFKREAIIWAWELLTQVWKIPAERLLVTIYQSDDEAFAIWHREVGLAAERIIRIGDNKGSPYASDNFWQMADTGPCGPCTEIFYDHGPDIPGGPPGSPDEDGDRFIEIWNNVFMQFDRQPDGSLLPLPAPCVDTGMGLERICAVLQHVHSNYEIDLFQHLIRAAAALTGSTDLEHKSLRVISDHIRASAFLIVDGVLPSNEGRGYVLRRIIRRAVRHVWKLGALREDGLFWRMVEPLCAVMGDAYPELRDKRELAEEALRVEEAAFAQTLQAGMERLEALLRQHGGIDGEALFLLHDTYGCPPDLVIDVLRERGQIFDPAQMRVYEQAMQQQRERARAASKFSGGIALPAELLASLGPTRFLGYEQTVAEDCKVAALVVDGKPVQQIEAGTRALVLLDATPFYAESGGQVGDTGTLTGDGGVRFVVDDTAKIAGQFHAHQGVLAAGVMRVGDALTAAIDAERRQAIVANHSATHLLHAALRTVLGPHVTQKGSLVAPDRLRFDFSHFRPVTPDELQRIEALINAQIRANVETEACQMRMQEALDLGAMALFGEKYGEQVRVLRMGSFSTELCGGTHVRRTGDIGLFKIASESGVAAGVRRIEAVTGSGAMAFLAQTEARLAQAACLLGTSPADVLEKLQQLLERQRRLERELEQIQAKAAGNRATELAAGAVSIGALRVVTARIEGADVKSLRETVDQLKERLTDTVIVLAGVVDGRASLVAGVSGEALARIKAGELIAHIARQIGGKGGGRADMAQGGGTDGPALVAALDSVCDWVRRRSA